MKCLNDDIQEKGRKYEEEPIDWSKEYKFDVLKLAYVHDDLYDYAEDAIAEFYMINSEPIVYEQLNKVRR